MLISYIAVLFLDVLFFREVQITVLYISIFSVFLFVFILLFKLLGLYFIKSIRKKGVNNRNIVILGLDQKSLDLEHVLGIELSFGYKILGYFSDIYIEYEDKKILGKIDDLYEFCQINTVHEVYFSVNSKDDDEIKKIISFCDSHFIRFKIIPEFQNFTLNRKINLDFYGKIPILHLRKEPLENPYNKLVKRLFDIVFSLLIILLIFPWLFPIVIFLYKISCKGSIFFLQKRSGQDNLVFNCIKFRTMQDNSFSDLKGTLKDDPRITPLGKFLRKTRIDELPQFINVLLGQMSVVGPRPHMIKHTEDYSKLVDQFLVRHFVKPGITGWAQTTGYIDESQKLQEMTDKVKKDVWYIENWSFALDIKIILLTILNIIQKDKNAF